MEGNLYRKSNSAMGQRLRKWQRRFFVLESKEFDEESRDVLGVYYRKPHTDQDSESLRKYEIPVRDILEVTHLYNERSGERFNITFRLDSTSESTDSSIIQYKLLAKSSEEAFQWTRALIDAIKADRVLKATIRRRSRGLSRDLGSKSRRNSIKSRRNSNRSREEPSEKKETIETSLPNQRRRSSYLLRIPLSLYDSDKGSAVLHKAMTSRHSNEPIDFKQKHNKKLSKTLSPRSLDSLPSLSTQKRHSQFSPRKSTLKPQEERRSSVIVITPFKTVLWELIQWSVKSLNSPGDRNRLHLDLAERSLKQLSLQSPIEERYSNDNSSLSIGPFSDSDCWSETELDECEEPMLVFASVNAPVTDEIFETVKANIKTFPAQSHDVFKGRDLLQYLQLMGLSSSEAENTANALLRQARIVPGPGTSLEVSSIDCEDVYRFPDVPPESMRNSAIFQNYGFWAHKASREVKRSSHRVGRKVYQDTFTGRDIVQWLVVSQVCESEEHAVMFCNWWIRNNAIYNVKRQEEDGAFGMDCLYRFRGDLANVPGTENEFKVMETLFHRLLTEIVLSEFFQMYFSKLKNDEMILMDLLKTIVKEEETTQSIEDMLSVWADLINSPNESEISSGLKEKICRQSLLKLLLAPSASLHQYLRNVFELNLSTRAHALAVEFAWEVCKLETLKRHICSDSLMCEYCKSRDELFIGFVRDFYVPSVDHVSFNVAVSMLNLMVEEFWDAEKPELFSQPILHPRMWKIFLYLMEGVEEDAFDVLMKDACSLVLGKTSNRVGLYSQEGWQDWVWPFIVSEQRSKSSYGVLLVTNLVACSFFLRDGFGRQFDNVTKGGGKHYHAVLHFAGSLVKMVDGKTHPPFSFIERFELVEDLVGPVVCFVMKETHFMVEMERKRDVLEMVGHVVQRALKDLGMLHVEVSSGTSIQKDIGKLESKLQENEDIVRNAIAFMGIVDEVRKRGTLSKDKLSKCLVSWQNASTAKRMGLVKSLESQIST